MTVVTNKIFRTQLAGPLTGEQLLFRIYKTDLPYYPNRSGVSARVALAGYVASGCGGTARCSVTVANIGWFWYYAVEPGTTDVHYEVTSPNLSFAVYQGASSLEIWAYLGYSATMITARAELLESSQ